MRPLKRRQKLFFKTDYRFMQVNRSILQYFPPSLSYHLSLRSLIVYFWPLKTSFTVYLQNKDLAKQEWDNIRGPPPDVNSEQYQKEIRRKIQEEKEAKLRLEQETNKS